MYMPALHCITKKTTNADTEGKMKKNAILGIFLLLFATALFAACTQAPGPVQAPDTVITYKFYGGFTLQTHAIQELVVTHDKAVFTIMSGDGNVTQKYEKALTKDQFDSIVKVFADNNFDSFGERYEEGQNYVTDVGYTDITFSGNGKSKTVTAFNYDEYLPKGLVNIRQKLRETVEFTQALDESQVKALAEGWIRGAPTYAYDGSNLTLVRYAREGSNPARHMLTYQFTGSRPGYGNMSGQAGAPGLTNHVMNVTIIDGAVSSAVIDEKWDETGGFLIGSEASLSYRPKMCEKTSWQVWEENSGRVYIRAPTDEEIITHYYASVYETEVRNVRKVQLDVMSCQACDVCMETYRFDLLVNASGMRPLLDEGWTRAA